MRRISRYFFIFLIFAMPLFHTEKSHANWPADLTCKLLFAPAQVKYTKLSRREQTITMSRQFDATAPESRANFRHLVFEDSARDLVSQLQLALRQTPRGLIPRRRIERQFVQTYADRLIRENEQRAATGDLTADWALRLGYHVSYLTNVLLRGTGNWGSLSISGAYAYRRFRYDDLTNPETLESVFNDVDHEALTFARTSIALVPSIHIYSLEGIIELMANGIHVLGLYPSKPSTILDYRHDGNHAALLIRALMGITNPAVAIDPAREAGFARGTTYARFRNRLATMVSRLKEMPDEKRSAGFAGLFYMFHEVPTAYAPVFVAEKIDSLQLQMTLLRMKHRIITQISNPEDMGHGYLERALVWNRTVANPERLATLAYEALTEASLGL